MSELFESGSVKATEGQQRETSQKGQHLLAAGGLLAALGATSCCILPLVLFSLGVSGAWIGNLTALSSYHPIFVAAAIGFLAVGYWRVYRRPAEACADGSACARPRSGQIAKTGLWVASVLVLAAVTFPYIAPLFL